MVAAIKKVLVTGASGLLGRDLISILSRSFDVIGLSKSRHIPDKPANVKEVQCDLSQDEAIKDVIDLGPEVIIHAAALTNVDFCQIHHRAALQHNVIATKNVVEAAKRIEAKFIYLSTDHVFDGKKDFPYTEEDRPNPVNIYGKTKLEAEKVVQFNLKNFIILRVSWLFGNPKIGFINFVLESAKKSKIINIVFDKRSSPTHTIDLSHALKYLVSSEKFSGEVLHFTNSGGGCSWFDYAKEILHCVGLTDVQLKPIKLEQLKLAAPRPMNSVLEISKFFKMHKNQVRSWQEALRDCLKGIADEDRFNN